MRRHSFLSCYGPQFVHGLVVLAAKSKYRPTTFLKKALSFPNHFLLLKEKAPRDFRAGDLRAALWSTILATWLVLGFLLFIIQVSFELWLGFVVLIVLLAPLLLILVGTAVLTLHARFPR